MSGTKCWSVIAEDPHWSLEQVPSLAKLCLQTIVKNMEVKPVYNELRPSEQSFIQENLTLHLPLKVTAHLIPEGMYWQRRCKDLWDDCDVSDYDHSWKRLFFERHMEKLIEGFLPGETELTTVLEMLPLCKDFVKRLNIEELLLPIQKQQEEDELTSIHEDAKPPLDHFAFNVMLEKLVNLEELHLWYRIKQCGMNFQRDMFRMTQGDCETLAKAVKTCRTLKVLHLYQSNLDDTQCRRLVKSLLDHPSLTELDFSYNFIKDRGARAIAELLPRSKLKTLTLYCNKIQEDGAKAIAQSLFKNSTLQDLNLGVNHVGDEGGQAIARALLKNSALKSLNLSVNNVGEQTAVALAELLVQNRTLRSINLFHGLLGVRGGKALREAMSRNTSVTHFVLDVTGLEQEDMDFIQEVVWDNEEDAA